MKLADLLSPVAEEPTPITQVSTAEDELKVLCQCNNLDVCIKEAMDKFAAEDPVFADKYLCSYKTIQDAVKFLIDLHKPERNGSNSNAVATKDENDNLIAKNFFLGLYDDMIKKKAEKKTSSKKPTEKPTEKKEKKSNKKTKVKVEVKTSVPVTKATTPVNNAKDDRKKEDDIFLLFGF